MTWERFYASERGERGMEIRNLFVKADIRRHRVGRALLCAATRAALAAECQRLRLGVRKDNAIGVQFYKQFGCTMYDMGSSWKCRWDRDGMLSILSNV